MAILRTFCTRCERPVYLGSDDAQRCPVCATPLASIKIEAELSTADR